MFAPFPRDPALLQINGREENLSTQLCVAHILNMAVTCADPSNNDKYRLLDNKPNHWPIKQIYQESGQLDNQQFIQCLCCRDVVLVKC